MSTKSAWLWGMVVGLSLVGCMPGRPAAEGDAQAEAPREVRVRDTEGAPWAPDDAPRMPVLELEFDTAPKHPASHLWLLRGDADADTLDDLVDPPLRAATMQRAVEVAVEAEERIVRAVPSALLEPGAAYALVFTHGSGEAHVTRLRISTSPVAGARLTATLPAEGDARVSPDTRRVLLVFDGYVDGLDAHGLRLVDASSGRALSTEVEVVSCRTLGLPEGDCAWLRVSQGFSARRSFALHVGPGLRDATGAALPESVVSFSIRAEPDDTPPTLTAPPCAPDELALDVGCVLADERTLTLRGAVDEPTLVTLSAGTERASDIAGAGFELTLGGLEPGRPVTAVLQLEDAAGHGTSRALSATTAIGLPRISIDEVRADPRGPEPAQEFVELLNFGAEPTQIMGYSLTDDAFDTGRVITTSLVIEPGERVLVVGPEFDASDASDGALPKGVRLARLDHALSLRNEGSALYLRDTLGRRLSAAPRLAANGEGQCIARVASDPRTGAPHAFEPDPSGTCTPGRATSSAP